MSKMIKMVGGLVFWTVFVAGAAVAAGKDTVTYEKDVKKIMAGRCMSCHGSASPSIEAFDKDKERFKKAMKGPRMDSYANLMVFVNGSDTGALMRRLDDGKNTSDGKPGNMYRNLGATDEERAANLKVIKNWVGGWTLKRKKDLAKKELKAIKAVEK